MTIMDGPGTLVGRGTAGDAVGTWDSRGRWWDVGQPCWLPGSWRPLTDFQKMGGFENFFFFLDSCIDFASRMFMKNCICEHLYP